MAIRTEAELANLLKSATAKQMAEVRQGVAEFTTIALVSREVSMKTIKGSLTAVFKAGSSAMVKNPALNAIHKELLESVAQGVDDAMAATVGAIRCASEHFLSLGAPTDHALVKSIVKVLDKFPQAFENTMVQAAAQFDPMMSKAWGEVLTKLKPASASIKAANEAAAAIRGYKTPAATSPTLLQAAASIRASIETYVAGVMLGQMKRK